MSAASYDFIAAGAVRTGPRAALRSPIESLHRATGAEIVQAGPWRLASYPAPLAPLTLADRSHEGKLDVRAPQAVLDALDAAPAVGRLRRDGERLLARLTARRLLVLCPFERVVEQRSALGPQALDVTCGFAQLAIRGEGWRELFARISALDVRASRVAQGRCLMGSVARCPAIVLHEREDELRILVGWEYGEHLWSVALDAGVPLGVRAASDAEAQR